MTVRLQARTLLTVFLIGLFAFVVIEAWDMPRQSRMFPLTIGAIALVILAYQFVREVFVPSRRGAGEPSGADMDFTEEEASREGKKRALELFAWIYGFVLGIWLIGFYIAVPLMIFLYLLRHRENRILLVALPAGIWLALWGVFDQLLHLPFPPGVLIEALGLA